MPAVARAEQPDQGFPMLDCYPTRRCKRGALPEEQEAFLSMGKPCSFSYANTTNIRINGILVPGGTITRLDGATEPPRFQEAGTAMLNATSLNAVNGSRFAQRFVKPLYSSYCFANLPGTIQHPLTGPGTSS